MTSIQPGDDRHDRLRRCIRDLAALSALPSMCVGRAPDEVIEIVVEALPTALSCELVHLELPDGIERAYFRDAPVSDGELVALREALRAEDSGTISFGPSGSLWCIAVDLPLGAERGRLIVGRDAPFDAETDRVLVRSAANLVGMTLQNATVLENARRKDEFLAVLGHELRNPLAPILTAAEMLAENPDAAREQKVIDRNTRHLARLVDDLLDISRVTRGQVELRKEHVTLAAVLERATEIAAPLIARHGHELRVGETDAAVIADPVRLAQVFGNLLNNAAKFTRPGGLIEISAERAGHHVRVRVRDNGRGIERADLHKIFEPFVQVDRRDQLRGGLGLGLAIVRDLVVRHGGTIRADSEGRGRGTTFTVELPIAQGVAPSRIAPRASAPADRGAVRVLVVDDNTDVAELLSLALGMQGFQTDVALDARAALERWRDFEPHAGVLDVGLPDLDGYELARSIRAEHGGEPTLIAATGYGTPSDRRMASEAGFDCHLVKPVSIRELISVLDQRVVDRAG